MKAIVKYGQAAGEVALREIPEPVCGKKEVKIEVKACAICATDLHILEGSYPWDVGKVLGHEFSGIIREVGAEVTGFKPGDRVASCMEGGFGKYCVKSFDDWIFPIPDSISFEEAALLEPLCSAANSIVNKSKILPGDVVLIEGPGAIGLFAMQIAKLSGAITILTGITKDGGRMQLAKELGCDYTLDVQRENLQELVMNLTQGRGVDTVIECTGSQAGLDTGLALLKTAGQLTQVGVFGKHPQIDLGRVVYHSQKIIGSIAFDRETWRRCIDLLDRKQVHVQEIISHTFPLEEWEKGFEVTKNQEGLRVLLIP